MKPAGSPNSVWRCVLGCLCAAAWIAAFVATHLPPRDLPAVEISDKVLHSAGFAGLSALLTLTLAVFGLARWRRIPLAIGLIILYAAVDEITQPLVHRTADVHDFLADALGGLLALVVCELLLALRRP